MRALTLSGLILVLVSVGALVGFVLKMRADALDDAAVRAANLASIVAEQVNRTMDAFDASLRATVRLIDEARPDTLRDLVGTPEFVGGLAVEGRLLAPAGLFGIADEKGVMLAGGRGGKHAGLSVADRDYFKALRDDPTPRLFVSKPVRNRATGSWMIFLSRRTQSHDGRFLGIVFIGVEPRMMIATTHAILSVPGQSFGLFGRDGALLVRSPEATIHAQVGEKIALPEWLEAAAGGGVYHSEGYFDGKPKIVAVRPLAAYPLVVSTTITDEGALIHWRQRASFVMVAGTIALALIGVLLLVQDGLRSSLARARLRSWLRAKRLTANATMLAEVRKRFGVTLDYMSHGIAMYDSSSRLLVANRSYSQLYDMRPEQLRPGMTLAEIFELRIANGAFSGGSPEAYRVFMQRPYPPVTLHHLNNGRIILDRTKQMDDGGWVSMQEDVTERIKSTERLAYMALHDGLTGLPNREAFRKRLGDAASRAASAGRKLVLLLIDIDDFKAVNDAYGHAIGDRVLVESTTRLGAAAPGASFARLGGDEFAAVAQCEVGDDACMIEMTDLIRREFRRTFDCDGRRISLGVSIGAAAIEPADADLERAMRRADLALVEAKRRGGECCVMFDMEMERKFEERAGLSNQLRAAIADGQLELHYQPIVDAHDRRILSMEALARWRLPTKGMISPAVFIPLAEEIGAIQALGDWVMRRACADAALWPKDVVVAVNVSSLQIERRNFADSVTRILEDTGLAPERLQIEITESVLLHNDRHIIAELQKLHDLGVTFALDDFGAGYASLGYLKTFPLDKIKIDKSFVDDVCENAQSVAIVGAVVALARGLGVAVTAEGVETRAQYETLGAMGVATMQGYYFGRPQPIAEQGVDFEGMRAA